MRLRRRKTVVRTRRQKSQAGGLDKAPSTFSYRAGHSEQGREGAKRQIRRVITTEGINKSANFWLQRLGLIVFLAAIVVSAFNILSLSTAAKVLPLNGAAESPFLRPVATYEDFASRQLKTSLWNRNKVTVDTTRLNQQLLDEFPELSSVSATVPLLAHRPVVYVQPAQPTLILAAKNGSFVVDNSGKALISANQPSDLSRFQLPVVNDQSGLKIRLNHQALPADNIKFAQTVIAQLAAKQFIVSGMTLPAASSELDVQLKGQPYFLKFNLQSNKPREQAGTFLATIARLRSQNVTPGQYVDIRVEGRAYYK